MSDQRKLGNGMFALMRVGISVDRGRAGRHLLLSVEAAEPDIPWNLGFLRIRSACYTVFRHPLAEDAESDLADFLAAEHSEKQTSSSTAKPPPIATAAK